MSGDEGDCEGNMTLTQIRQFLNNTNIKTGWTIDGALNILDTNPDSVALLTIRSEGPAGYMFVSNVYESEYIAIEDILPFIRGFVHGYRSERQRYR